MVHIGSRAYTEINLGGGGGGKILRVNSKYFASWILLSNTYSPNTLQVLLYLSFKQIGRKKNSK